MDAETDATCGLTNHSTLLQCIVDAFDRVVLHAYQEARAELWLGRTSIEESWGSVNEEALGHQVVCFDGTIDVAAVDADSNTHDEMLRTLRRAAIDFQKV